MLPNKSTYLSLETLDDRLVPAVVDLTTLGASATLANGAIVHRIDAAWNNANGPAASGTGSLQTFVRIDANGVEEGYNTNARPFQLDQKGDLTVTRAITLGNVPIVTVGGNTYREFILNVNEPKGGRLLSLDEARIYLSNVGTL